MFLSVFSGSVKTYTLYYTMGSDFSNGMVSVRVSLRIELLAVV